MTTTEHAQAFAPALPIDRLQSLAPAAFADRPYIATSPRYVFISTAQLVHALIEAGFQPMDARQTNAHGDRAGYARHLIRFRHPRASLTLTEAIPEIILINSHDGTSAYQLRAGLYRPVCTNGLITRVGDFGLIYVPHRGNVLANVVDAALAIVDGFAHVGDTVQLMAQTPLEESERLAFASAAIRIRYRPGQHVPFPADRLLHTRRAADVGNDVWRTYNVIQENLIRGGVSGTTLSGRVTSTRGIRAIREDVRINNELWQFAMSLLRA